MSGAGLAQAQAKDPITHWVQSHAGPLDTTDPNAPLGDLQPLDRMVGDAVMVGLGESTHGSYEQFTLKHRVVRLLVEQLGFRSLAMEEDWASGIDLDRYLRTGQGDPTELVKAMRAPWNTREVQAVLEWSRAWNAATATRCSSSAPTSTTPACRCTTRSPATSSRPPPSCWRNWRSISR